MPKTSERNKEYIILTVLIIITVFLRLFNSGELTGGDDSEYAQLFMYALDDPSKFIYPGFPDEPIGYVKFKGYARPFAIIPMLFIFPLFGFTAMTVKMPAVIFSALSAILLFFLAKRFMPKKAAYLAVLLFAVSPFHMAFTRIGILDGALTFYLLAIFLLVFKGLEEKKLWMFYAAGGIALISYLTSPVRGLVPLIALVPFVLMYKTERRYKWHLLIAAFSAVAAYLIYIFIPVLLFENYAFVEDLKKLLFGLLGVVGMKFGIAPVRTDYLPPLESAWMIAKTIFLTPFLNIIAVPALFGVYYAVRKIKKPFNTFFLAYLATSVFYFTHGGFHPNRLVIFTTAFVLLAAKGIWTSAGRYVKSKKKDFALLAFLTFFFILFTIKEFPSLFTDEYASMAVIMAKLGIGDAFAILGMVFWPLLAICTAAFIYILFHLDKSSFKRLSRRKKFAAWSIGVFLIINIIAAFGLVISGVGIYHRPEAVRDVADYLVENLDDEKYSCVAGIHEKTLTFYTQRTCAFWIRVDTDWLDEQASAGNLNYFVINTYYSSKTPGFGDIDEMEKGLNNEGDEENPWLKNYRDKYEWLMNNTVEVTGETYLGENNSYFRIFRYQEK